MDYAAPFNLPLTIVLNLTAAQANGNLGTLAGSPLATSQFSSDTVVALSTFTIAPTFQWIMSGAVYIIGTVINNGKIVII
jgi:hypothetical protein